MIILLGVPKQENSRRPEIPLEKIDNEARISKKAEMKIKFNINQKRIPLWDIQLSSLIFSAIYRWWQTFPKVLIIRFFLIPHTRRWYASFVKPLGNACERISFNTISALQPANAIKTKFLANSFHRFSLLSANS